MSQRENPEVTRKNKDMLRAMLNGSVTQDVAEFSNKMAIIEKAVPTKGVIENKDSSSRTFSEEQELDPNFLVLQKMKSKPSSIIPNYTNNSYNSSSAPKGPSDRDIAKMLGKEPIGGFLQEEEEFQEHYQHLSPVPNEGLNQLLNEARNSKLNLGPGNTISTGKADYSAIKEQILAEVKADMKNIVTEIILEIFTKNKIKETLKEILADSKAKK